MAATDQMMAADYRRTTMAATAGKIYDITGNKIGIIDGGKHVKLRKDGKPKKTHTNTKSGRSTWVDPIRNKADIKRVLDYLQAKIDNEPRIDYKKAWARNKLYFNLVVFTGLRVSDVIGARKETKFKNKDVNGNIYYSYPEWTGLKWQDIYCKDGKTFRKEIAIKELKRGYMRKTPITETMQRYFSDYVEKYNPDTTEDNYIFVNRQKERLSYKSIDAFIKEATAACGIDGNFSTHSLRKTFVYQLYMSLVSKVGEEMALAKTMSITGHRNMSDLLRYLGVNKKNIGDAMEGYEDWMSDVF